MQTLEEESARLWRFPGFVAVAMLAALIGGGFLLLAPGMLQAQEAGARVRGHVTAAESGEPIAGVHVRVDGFARGARSDADGAFEITGVPRGERVLVLERLGRRTERVRIRIGDGGVVTVDPVAMVVEALPFNEIVISATREARLLSETPATVNALSGTEIRQARATHPSEIMGALPGVWVNVTGGEGHMTAIRQPLTTEPVYLYLSDGVPTRSTGFFNHNALYEINLPASERIEVVKGPVTALHGSDAIGGTINVETRSSMADPGLDVSLEGGGHGYARLLASYAAAGDAGGIRTDLNLTRTDGWREGTGYDRQSATVRWDQVLGVGSSLKAVAAYSRIDQSTAGASRLPESVFRSDPTLNLTPVSYRNVQAARLSVEYERQGERSLLSVTPFARRNEMDMLPNWSLTYDPAIWKTSNHSIGLLARYRRSFDAMRGRIIAGMDVDRSPGEHFERRIAPVREDGVFRDFEGGDPIYDYGVTFLGVSPYLHAEASPTERLRVTGGMRFDRIGYDYSNRLDVLQSGPHRRPASTEVNYSRLSPKLGATFALGGGTSLFASFGRGFRAPAEGQLFRQGGALSTVDLEPVVATSWEAGARGSIGRLMTYTLSAYHMTKENDILAFQREDDVRETRNAGGTVHEGVEVGVGARLPGNLTLRTALSVARHTYSDWRPAPSIDYGGREMESAPRTLGNATLGWTPRGPTGPRLSLGWSHLGSYWLNPENTERYGGHDLFEMSGSWPVTPALTLFARVNNLTDESYAESGGYSHFTGREFAPGLPRTLHAGVQVWPGWSR